jgi:hypothetical protein
MKLLSAALILISLTAHADENFTRMQTENEHYKDYTREEMTSKFGSTKDLLPLYACNGRDELDLFWMPRKNLKKNSLNIQLYKFDEILNYQNGKYFDQEGLEVLKHTNSFVLELIPVLKKLESIPETQKMLRMLEVAPYPVTIKLGNNSFNPKEVNGKNYHGIYMANAISILDHGRMTSENIPFYDIGVGGLINWNPKTENLPGAVSLAHEMFHALDSVRGTLDMRFVIGEAYEMTLVSEYRAVYMENITRKASGIPYRVYYGELTSGPGVLDENGEPRFISAPCLR